MINMNLKQAALFEYSFEYFLSKIHNAEAKKCIWEFNGQLLTATFHDSTLFSGDEFSKQLFNDRLKEDALKLNTSHGDSLGKFQRNFPLLINTLSTFVVDLDNSQYTLTDFFLAKNVSFLGKNIDNLDFYLFPKDADFKIVSITSSETRD